MSRRFKKQLARESRVGDVDKVGELLGRGVPIDHLYRDGLTPLMRAVYYGHERLTEFLLARGADPNRTARDGASALFWACVRGHEAIVNRLLAAGADVNAVRRPDDSEREARDGPSPLNAAISGGHKEITAMLVEAGASLDHRYLGRDIREYAEWHWGREFLPLLSRQRRGGGNIR